MNKLPKTSFESIDPILDKEHKNIFKALDKLYYSNKENWNKPEKHTKIIKLLDKLYRICYKHWKTEDKYFIKGLQNIPKEHHDINKEIQKHREQHKSMLKCILKIKTEIKQNKSRNPSKKFIQMKKDIINHINNEDADHFHWS